MRACRRLGHVPTEERCDCCGKPVQCSRCGASDVSMSEAAYRRFLGCGVTDTVASTGAPTVERRPREGIVTPALRVWCWIRGHDPFHFTDGTKAFAVCRRCGKTLRRV